MAKKVDRVLKLQIVGGQANPAPPVGPALGQAGINIIIPVEITVFADKSFTFKTKTPPAAVLLMKAAKIKSGSGEPNRNKVGRVTWAQCKEIAEQKMEDLNAYEVEHAAEMIAGTARSMGLRVIRD